MSTRTNLVDENAVPGAPRLDAKRMLGGKRTLGGKLVSGPPGKGGGKPRGLSARRVLGDVTNGKAAATQKPHRARAAPRDAGGRIEEPEYFPAWSPERPGIVAPSLFSDGEMPIAGDAAEMRRADLTWSNFMDEPLTEPAGKPPRTPESASPVEDDYDFGPLPLFSAAELMEADPLDLVLVDDAC